MTDTFDLWVISPCQMGVGGGEGVEGMYGSITQAGMQLVFECLYHNTGFDTSSCLVDVGAGIGRQVCAVGP